MEMKVGRRVGKADGSREIVFMGFTCQILELAGALWAKFHDVELSAQSIRVEAGKQSE